MKIKFLAVALMMSVSPSLMAGPDCTKNPDHPSCAVAPTTLGDLNCSSGQIAKSTGTDWECGEDIDTTEPNTDTLADLTCASGEVAQFGSGGWECTAVQAQLGSCADGQFLQWSQGASEWQCVDSDLGTLLDRISTLEARLENHDGDGDGYTPSSNDCDDLDDAVYPGAFEITDDGIDNDCDGNIDYQGYTDSDGDGYFAEVDDCDDTRADVYPGNNIWYPDYVDHDCTQGVVRRYTTAEIFVDESLAPLSYVCAVIHEGFTGPTDCGQYGTFVDLSMTSSASTADACRTGIYSQGYSVQQLCR